MKVFKRNAVIITVLLFVAVAVYLNWSYNRGQNLAVDNLTASDQREETQDDATDEDADTTSLYFAPPQTTLSAETMNYFANARLTREQARDSATAILQDAASIGTASETDVTTAIDAITAMATFALQEAQLENILLAKDFEQVVVFIRNEGVSVIVNAPPGGLSDVSVARITDAVISELGVPLDQLTIVPVTG